jgi:hypothetical protein
MLYLTIYTVLKMNHIPGFNWMVYFQKFWTIVAQPLKAIYPLPLQASFYYSSTSSQSLKYYLFENWFSWQISKRLELSLLLETLFRILDQACIKTIELSEIATNGS